MWQPFLTGTKAAFTATLLKSGWKQARWPFRATVFRITVLYIIGVVFAIFIAAIMLGMIDPGQMLRASGE